MASKRLRKNGTWEFTVKCKNVREKPFYFTFDTKEEGEEYTSRLEALIRQGIVPTDLTDESYHFETVGEVIKSYLYKSHTSS
ncbi:MAG: site-specific integrase, partial [Candidatus Bathyarchaeota archaeon]|nr:site-specific integrase [Candidatus Bathyarchaeota archaeon]